MVHYDLCALKTTSSWLEMRYKRSGLWEPIKQLSLSFPSFANSTVRPLSCNIIQPLCSLDPHQPSGSTDPCWGFWISSRKEKVNFSGTFSHISFTMSGHWSPSKKILKTYLFQSFCSFMLFCKGSLGFLEGTIKSKLLLLLDLHDLI